MAEHEAWGFILWCKFRRTKKAESFDLAYNISKSYHKSPRTPLPNRALPGGAREGEE